MLLITPIEERLQQTTAKKKLNIRQRKNLVSLSLGSSQYSYDVCIPGTLCTVYTILMYTIYTF